MVNQAYGLRDELMHTDFAKLYQEVAGSQGGINKSIMSNKADKVDVLHLKEKGIRYNPKTLIPAALAGGIAGYAGAAALGVGAMASGGAIAAAAFFGAGFHRGIKKLPETLAHFADIMEMATRLGVARYAYKAALANNPSLTPYQAMQEAAYASRNIFDGSRKGSRMLSIVRLVPFMNAHEQHVVVSLEKFIGRHDRGLGMSPVKMGGAMAVAFTGATLAAGPIAGVAAAAATPVALMTAAQRSEAVRLAMRPFFKQAEGAPLSNEERRALGDSAKMWSNYVLYALLMFALSQLRGDDEKSDQEYEMIKDQLHEQWVPFKIGDTWYKTPLAFQLGTGYIILKAAVFYIRRVVSG